jgi:penicillin-binding protein 2
MKNEQFKLIFLSTILLLAILLFLGAKNVKNIKIETTPRGNIFDRNGVLLAGNDTNYVCTFNPSKLTEYQKNVLLNSIGSNHPSINNNIIIGIDSSFVFPKLISSIEYRKLQHNKNSVEGLIFEPNFSRTYQVNSIGALIGYSNFSGLIEKKELLSMEDILGVNGIEKYYNSELSSKDNSDTINTGEETNANVYTTIDINLQLYGQELMKGHKGAILISDARNGEILTAVSSPEFSSIELSNQNQIENYNKLLNDHQRPLINRITHAYYSPGASITVLNNLYYLGCKDNNFISIPIKCEGSITENGKTIKCSKKHDIVSIYDAYILDCDIYQYQIFKNIMKRKSIDTSYVEYINFIKEFIHPVLHKNRGLNILRGNIGTKSYFEKYFGLHKWNSSNLMKLSIGNEFVGFTSLQMMNILNSIVNEGYYYTPSIVTRIGKNGIIKPIKNEIALPVQAFKALDEVLPFDIFFVGQQPNYFSYISDVTHPTNEINNSMYFAFSKSKKISMIVIIEDCLKDDSLALEIGRKFLTQYLNK